MASQFDVDDEQELNLFQEHFPHLAAPPTELELEEVHRYLDICSRMSKGWLAEAIRKLDAKKVERAKQMEQYNPFEDVPQYGKKTTAEKVPRFSDFPFSKRLRVNESTTNREQRANIIRPHQKRNTSLKSCGT